MKRLDYKQQLDKTAQFLKRARTAAEIAEKFGLSRFAAYERLQALARAGRIQQVEPANEPGKTGPKAVRWVAV